MWFGSTASFFWKMFQMASSRKGCTKGAGSSVSGGAGQFSKMSSFWATLLKQGRVVTIAIHEGGQKLPGTHEVQEFLITQCDLARTSIDYHNVNRHKSGSKKWSVDWCPRAIILKKMLWNTDSLKIYFQWKHGIPPIISFDTIGETHSWYNIIVDIQPVGVSVRAISQRFWSFFKKQYMYMCI